jgi:predicted  nucleic acid-binding Zn-ribbon protein
MNASPSALDATTVSSCCAQLAHASFEEPYAFGTFEPALCSADEDSKTLRREKNELLRRVIAVENELQGEKDRFFAEFGVLANNMQRRTQKAELDCDAQQAAARYAEECVQHLNHRVKELEQELARASEDAGEARQQESATRCRLQEAEVKLEVMTSKLEVDKHPKQLKHLKEELIRLEKEKKMLSNENASLDAMLDSVTRKLNGLQLVAQQNAERLLHYEHAALVLAADVVRNVEVAKVVFVIRQYLDLETKKMLLAKSHGRDALYNKAASFVEHYSSGGLDCIIERAVLESAQQQQTDPNGAHRLAVKLLRDQTHHT